MKEDAPSLAAQRKEIPHEPGVYFFRDERGETIYIGKAKDLKRRVDSHFARPAGPRGEAMIARVRSLEWVVLGSEHEALVAEQNFIQRYRPHYNVRLKDDRTYPWIAVSLDEEYPRLFLTREKHRSGRKYFGPYSDARSARRIADLVGRAFQLRSCTGAQPGRSSGSPCLDYHIGRCSAPCTDQMSKAAYRAQAEQAVACLAGGYSELQADLQGRMAQASREQHYEVAARYRDLIKDLDLLAQKQKVAGIRGGDFDLAALHLEGEEGNMQLWRVRGGALEGQVGFYVRSSGQTREEAFLSALLDYYENQETVPSRIFTDAAFAQSKEGKGLQQLLELDRGSAIQVMYTQRGAKHQLWQSLARNTHLALGREQLREQEKIRRSQDALGELSRVLGSADLPRRIECYDVSHLGGTHTKASMVVFEDGFPKPADYRLFRIEDQPGSPDDYQSLREALRRRVAQWEANREMSPYDPRYDASFGSKPDLVLIDGGLGQLEAVRKAVQPLLDAGTAILSLAKEEEILFNLCGEKVDLSPTSPAKLLLQHARDEAHRFALRLHRRSRDGAALSSSLDQVPGVGPARRKKLLARFGDARAIQRASQAELETVVPPGVARALKEHLVEA